MTFLELNSYWNKMNLFNGMLMALPGRRGVGKLNSIDGSRCTLSVFFSFRRFETFECELREIERAYLSPQTRVYYKGGQRWQIGRVTDFLMQEGGRVTYEVRFPNGNQRDISEVDLFVRPWNAPEDPAEILAAGGAETQYLHDRRQTAMERLQAFSSAAQGLTAILSAGIDFVPHQIAAVRRVLSDPIQRYLLADEVGLGKTIEAGLIVRQHLIDTPEAEVLIATPPQLCEQWRRELSQKLRLDQFGDAFECCSHADLIRVDRTPDILIVDEAHHLVGAERTDLERSAARLRELARDVPVLLLLSATPPLGNEARFLALLNLLDPQTHPLDDIEGFRVKLDQRRAIGRLLLSLDPDGSSFVLRQRAAELERTFPDDPIIGELAPRLVAATRDAPGELPHICAMLKEHIADSYRIHQRLIRSRRADSQGWEFTQRGPNDGRRTHVRTESDPSEALSTLLATIEDWRCAAVDALATHAVEQASVTERYREMLNAIGEGASALRTWLADLAPIFDGEEEILTALTAQSVDYSDDDRIAMMVESTRRLINTLRADVEHPKIVVFATQPTLAAAFYEKLHQASEGTVCFLLSTDIRLDGVPDGDDSFATQFEIASTTAVLTTDRSAEEGLNLSFANAIVHLDMPLSAARIEQRIGRLDRYGRRKGIIRHRICLPADDGGPWAAWLDLVADGLEIFDRSISDVQFLLESFEEKSLEALILIGPDSLGALATEVRSQVAYERKSQDEQYALDRIALVEEPVEAFIEALEDAESDEGALEAGVDEWLVGALQLKKRPFAWPNEDPFKLSATKQTLIPLIPWQREIDLVDREALTWKRRIATRNPNVTLLRPGTTIVDVLTRFTRWDDRGTAFITYRKAPDWFGDPWIGFKLCFTIEPNLELRDLLSPSRAELAALRRAQRYFSPITQTLFLDINGEPVTDQALLTVLSKPYDGHLKGRSSDINLGSRPEMLADYIDPTSFETVCSNARNRARLVLTETPRVLKAIADATMRATEDLQRGRSRLQRRHSAGDKMAKDDLALIESILPSISMPAIRLDAMGSFVVGSDSRENYG